MISPPQVRYLIVYPVLNLLALHKTTDQREASMQLLMGTAMQESGCGDYIAQVGGPALGVWQMESPTFDAVTNWTGRNRVDIAAKIDLHFGPAVCGNLPGNLYLACAYARMLYFSVPAALPAKGDVAGQAAYYKQYYNSPLGAATVEEFTDNWHKVMALLA